MTISLRKKLTIWFVGTMLIAFIPALLLSFWYFNKREEITKTLSQVNNIYFTVLKNRSLQYDFFNVDTRNPSFYVKNSSSNLEYLDIENRRMRGNFCKLKKLQIIDNEDLLLDVTNLSQLHDSSLHVFNAITNLLFQRGFKDEGLIGNMRTNAHKIEQFQNIDMVTLLMLRRHEKDFMLRIDSLYVYRFNALVGKFTQTIKNSNQYSANEKTELLNYLKQYALSFNELVDLEYKLGIRVNHGLKQQLDEIYTHFDVSYRALEAKVENSRNKMFAQMELLFALFLGLLVVSGIWLSIRISKLLSNPLKQVTKYVVNLRKSEFNYRPLPDTKYATREIETLYFEFGKMIEMLRTREDERNVAEKNLRNNELKYRDLANLLPQGIFETDSNGFITYVNKTWTNTFGYSLSEVKNGLTISQLFDCEAPLKLNSNNESQAQDCIAYGKDGKKFPVSVYTSSIVKNGNEVGIRALVIDETVRRKYIKELEKARRKAEESDRLKSAFLSNMSHEIRTPMNAIIGFSNLLSSTKKSDTERDEYIHYIKSSGKHLLKLIDDIIDIAKIEAGELKVEQTACNVDEMLDELFQIFSKTAGNSKELEIIRHKDNFQEPLLTITDPYRLKQILTNLIGNAVKFTSNGYVEFGCSRFGNMLQFYVKDTGPGIAPHMHHAIFERFRRDENSKFSGTGLGLTITKSLISLLDGRIWLKSEEGKGATFFFTIPYLKTKSMENSTNNLQQEDIEYLAGKRLLIAEDNDINFSLVEKQLAHSGLLILRAVNGRDAIRMCAKGVDIVLMDMQMPLIDGYIATREIKRLRPELPIIAHTAYVLESEKKQCMAVGCDGYLSKPFQRDELIALLCRCLAVKEMAI